MTPLKWMLRPLVPIFLGEILDARKALSRVSDRPWTDAFSAANRLAWEQLRLAILPQKLLPLSFATFHIQGATVTGLYAVYQVVEHFGMHYGQILFITKLVRGESLGFYSELDKTGRPG